MKRLSTTLILFLLATCLALCDVVDFEAGVYVNDGAGRLTVAQMSTPTTADWNNDGKLDLIVGQFTSGNIWLYLNQGSRRLPVFDGGSQILSGGAPITTSYG